MTRELRTTLAIMLAVLILGAPIIFADVPQTQGNASYLALVFRLAPSVTPTETPTPTTTPTLTPTATNTPGPTNTPPPPPTPDIPPIQSPCDQNQPPQPDPYAQAWMTIPNPSKFSQTTVCARFITQGGAVYRGAILYATAHYKTTDTYLGAATARVEDGVAHISFNIGGATSGYPVIVDGTIAGWPFSTQFTPP